MKINSEYVIKNIAGENIVIFIGDNMKNKVINLNGVGAFLFEALKKAETEEVLLEMLLNEYDVDEKTARRDVSEFLKALREAGAID